jgi:hypothetical protein
MNLSESSQQTTATTTSNGAQTAEESTTKNFLQPTMEPIFSDSSQQFLKPPPEYSHINGQSPAEATAKHILRFTVYLQ